MASHSNPPPPESLQNTGAWIPPAGILTSWSGCSLGMDIFKSSPQDQLHNLQGLVQNENAGLAVQNLLRILRLWWQSIKLSMGPVERGGPCTGHRSIKSGLAAQVGLRSSQSWEPWVKTTQAYSNRSGNCQRPWSTWNWSLHLWILLKAVLAYELPLTAQGLTHRVGFVAVTGEKEEEKEGRRGWMCGITKSHLQRTVWATHIPFLINKCHVVV